ncbi:MAG: hypothetical protein ACFFBR_10750, partial [Promethearchaeota archaeon]
NFMYPDSVQCIGTHRRFHIMADEGTSSTLVLVAAVLQLIFFFVLAGLTGLFALVLAALPSIPPSMLPPGSPPLAEFIAVMASIAVLFVVMTAFALIFTILWFMWRSSPSQHKVGLIISGIIALLFSGILPGILVIIAGAIAPSSSIPTPPPTTVKQVPSKPEKGVKYCSACGNPVTNPNAEFCGVCGASLAE